MTAEVDAPPAPLVNGLVSVLPQACAASTPRDNVEALSAMPSLIRGGYHGRVRTVSLG